jgi:hypothetical protein
MDQSDARAVAAISCGYVRLRVHTNSEVKVPTGQGTGPKHSGLAVRNRRKLRHREMGWEATGDELPVHKQDHAEHDTA